MFCVDLIYSDISLSYFLCSYICKFLRLFVFVPLCDMFYQCHVGDVWECLSSINSMCGQVGFTNFAFFLNACRGKGAFHQLFSRLVYVTFVTFFASCSVYFVVCCTHLCCMRYLVYEYSFVCFVSHFNMCIFKWFC